MSDAALSGLDFLRGLIDGSLPAPPFAATTGIDIVSAENGTVVFTGTPPAGFRNPMGVVHGGWTATLLDTAMGCAVHSSLPPGKAYTTIGMSTTFARAVTVGGGPLTARGVLLHRGGRIASAEATVTDGEGRLVAHGTETCLIRDVAQAGRQAPEREGA